MFQQGKKLIKNEYVFSILTRFISVGISFILSILVARYLGANLQGTSSYITSIANIGAVVITFGMHQAYAYYRKTYGKEAVFQDYMSLAVLLYGILTVIAGLYFFTGSQSFELRTAVLLIPVYGYAKIAAYVCLIESPNTRNLWATIIGFADIFFVILLWIFTQRGETWLLLILLFSSVLSSIIFTIILKPRIRFHKGLFRLALKLGKYGFFPMVALLMTTLNYKIDILMLKQYPEITSAMIGIYTIGIQMADRIILIPDTLKGVLVSRLSKGSDEHEVANACRLSFWSSCAMCICFIALGQFIIQLLYGPEYHGAYTALVISSFGTVAISYFKLIAQYNIVNKRQILNVVMLSVAIVADVLFNLLFIPLWGINGAALATGIGNFVCGIVFVIWFSRKTKIPLREMVILQKRDIELIKKYLHRSSKTEGKNSKAYS